MTWGVIWSAPSDLSACTISALSRCLNPASFWGSVLEDERRFADKVGSRFAALEPIAQGLGRLYGSVEADVARGLALRMDHGSQYLSDHFLNQFRYWGIHPSFGFVEEPETNGVVERWNRTLKEQAVYGRVFRNLAEVRAAVAAFVERYNQCWRLEKLAYRTPLEAREQYELRHAA